MTVVFPWSAHLVALLRSISNLFLFFLKKEVNSYSSCFISSFCENIDQIKRGLELEIFPRKFKIFPQEKVFVFLFSMEIFLINRITTRQLWVTWQPSISGYMIIECTCLHVVQYVNSNYHLTDSGVLPPHPHTEQSPIIFSTHRPVVCRLRHFHLSPLAHWNRST